MLRTIIIDDEPNARQVVKNILQQYCKSVDIIGEAANVADGVAIIKSTNPDLVLLDIRMPDGTGFDLLKKVGKLNFNFIFISAHEEYALRAIKQSALDYIVKPINTNELISAIEKAELSPIKEGDMENRLLTLDHNQNANNQDKRLVLNTQDSIYVIQVKHIISCRADKNYTEVNIENKKQLVLSKTLKDIEEMLEGCGFFRSHQSHLVNLKHISHYEKGLGGTIIMTDSSRIPVSSRKKDLFIQIMNRL